MQKEAVLHIPDSSYAFALDEKTLVLRLRAAKKDLSCCTLYYGDRADERDPIMMTALRMECVASDGLFDWFECTLHGVFPRVCYYFVLQSEQETLYYYADAFHADACCARSEYYQFPYLRREDIVRVPDWAARTVFYQIFPDSFADGRRSIGGKSIQPFHGGTLRGITENLDYIQNLGATCLYLNPIFAAGTPHRYDTADYYRVDPRLGTLGDLKELVVACHRKGMRVMLDGVFNHCGSEFFAFRDVLEHGEASRYASWFYRMDFPVAYQSPPNYATFAHVKEMPKLNTGNPEVIAYFCEVGAYWVREADIDGWRLDVANEVNHAFWRGFRRAVKMVRPDALLIGEIWEDAQQWLLGDQLDSAMNYRFSNLCRDFFAERRMDAREFGEALCAMQMRYKSPVTGAQMNLLDSHDVPRFLTKCGGDLRRWKLSFLFMMTFPGAPSIYYGDELGVSGKTEPEYRRAMPWERIEEQCGLYGYVRELAALRDCRESLRAGSFHPVPEKGDEVFAFYREGDREVCFIVLNNGEAEQVFSFPASKQKNSWRRLFPSPEVSYTHSSRKIPSMTGEIWLEE